jgi:dTMP kinase
LTSEQELALGQGIFITFEGGEGGGKSTQVKRLAGVLQKQSHDVIFTREPGGAVGAELIRGLLLQGDTGRWDGTTEMLLHYAARRDHVVQTVWPALARGQVVISDRFADSTMAYQGFGHGLDRASITAVHRASLGDFQPDLTLILDLPVEIGLARALSRPDMAKSVAEDRYERMGTAFHERLRQGFLTIARENPSRCKVIDASRDIDAIHSDILAAVSQVLRGR